MIENIVQALLFAALIGYVILLGIIIVDEIKLKRVTDGMNKSIEDMEERAKAERQQTEIRYEKLKAFNNKIEAAERTICVRPNAKSVETPKHDCPDDLLRAQQRVMGEYLHILEVRAVIEGIEL